LPVHTLRGDGKKTVFLSLNFPKVVEDELSKTLTHNIFALVFFPLLKTEKHWKKVYFREQFSKRQKLWMLNVLVRAVIQINTRAKVMSESKNSKSISGSGDEWTCLPLNTNLFQFI
jgi:hypothetical protein